MISISQNPSGEFFDSNSENFQNQYETMLELFNQSEDIVQAGRNTLKKITFEGSPCVIKSFRIPSFPQNFSYGLFAKSKAKKSYDNAKSLLKLGFHTPAPVAYIEYKSGGKLKESFYICEYASDTKTLHEWLYGETEPPLDLIKQFAQFCYSLHDKGVLHRDFNPKNVLISQTGETFTFSLVDINRITWSGKLSLKQSMTSLSRIPNTGEAYQTLLLTYSEISGIDIENCKKCLRKSELKTQRYFRNKSRLRKIFPKK